MRWCGINVLIEQYDRLIEGIRLMAVQVMSAIPQFASRPRSDSGRLI